MRSRPCPAHALVMRVGPGAHWSSASRMCACTIASRRRSGLSSRSYARCQSTQFAVVGSGSLTRSARERLLDRVDDLGSLREHQRREARDDVAVAADEELLEVPADVAGVALGVGGLGERLVQRVATLAVDLHLLGEREGHAVVRLAERLDLVGRTRLLLTELVARDPDHVETLAL